MRTWLWLSMALGVAMPAFAFEGKVVTDDGTPLVDATVSILGHPGSSRTDRQGLFVRSPDPPLPFEVLVVLPGGQYMAPVLVEELPADGPVLIVVSPLVNETITVAGGTTPNIEAAPASGMSVVPRQDIEQRHPVRLTDILANVPGTGQASDLHAAVPSIRGLARGRTLILIDGARVSTERRAGPSAAYLDPFFLEGVEVSRGPGSVAYGSDAFGGVIDARTKRPDLESPLSFRFAGSLGAGIPERSGGAEISKGFGEGGLLFQARYRNFDDYRSPEGEVPNSGATDWGFLGRGSYELGPGQFSVGWQSDQGRDIGRPTSTNDVTRVLHPREDSDRLTIGYDMDASAGFTRIAFNGFLGSYRLVTDREEQPTAARPRRTRSADVSARDFSIRALVVRPLGPSRLELGLDINGRFDLEALDSLRLYDREDREVAEVEQASIEDAHRTDTGMYASTEFMLGRKVTGGAGLRFDHVTTGNRGGFFGDQSTSNDSLSGFASLQVELASRLSLTGQVSRGFRDPFLSDRYFFGVSGRGLVTGNPALEPETSLQFDLALRSARSRFRWAVYGYRYRIDDLIERFELGDGLFFFRNRGQALLRGVELEVVGELTSGLTLQVGAQVESGEAVDDDTPLDDIPAERVTVQLRKQIGEGNYALVQAALVARDDDPGPTETETPGYVLVDLGGGWRLSSWGSLRAWVRNLLDKAYPVSADRRAVLAPGISVVVTFVAEF